jgi:hypothetical protein
MVADLDKTCPVSPKVAPCGGANAAGTCSANTNGSSWTLSSSSSVRRRQRYSVGQIESVVNAVRLFGDTELNLYPTRHDPALAFPNQVEEIRFATVTIAGPNGKGKADVHVVLGHLFQITFKPRPKELGDVRRLRVETATVHVDPMIPAVDLGIEQRLEGLDAAVRAELDAMWADGSADRLGLSSPSEIYRAQREDGEYLLLAQLDDTTFLVAPIDPPGPGVKRFEPDGELLGEYHDVRSALSNG